MNTLWSETIPALEASQREALARTLGLDFILGPSGHVRFEVRALNFANRSATDGLTRREAILWLQQARQLQADGASIPFEGGCTLVIDLDTAGGALCGTQEYQQRLTASRRPGFSRFPRI